MYLVMWILTHAITRSVHDGDIAPMITALDVINDPDNLPATHIAHARKWRKSQVSPMGGRIILEVLSCKAKYQSRPTQNLSGENSSSEEQDRRAAASFLDGKFVRLNINDGITALPDCNSGPGRSCPLPQFVARTKRREGEVGSFKVLCNLDDGVAGGISFLKQ